jgi:hypothetical protein
VPGDHAQDRRLAAAGRAEKAAIGAVRNRQVDVLDRIGVTELLGEVDQPDLSRSRRAPSRRPFFLGVVEMLFISSGPPALNDEIDESASAMTMKDTTVVTVPSA